MTGSCDKFYFSCWSNKYSIDFSSSGRVNACCEDFCNKFVYLCSSFSTELMPLSAECSLAKLLFWNNS